MSRFTAVLKHLEIVGLAPGDVVLDWGCGTGKFSEMLPQGVTYIGADISPALIERAKVEHPERQFFLVDDGADWELPEPCAHVVAIGTWNLPNEDIAGWAQAACHLEEVAGLFAHATKSFVGSFLAEGAAEDSEIEHVTYPAVYLIDVAERVKARWCLDHSHRDNDYILRLQH